MYSFNFSCCILLLAVHSPSFCSFLVSLWSCHFSSHLWSASHQARPVSVPGQFVWDLWWWEWHWEIFLSQYFTFPLSATFHQFSLLIHSSTATLCNLTINSLIKPNTYFMFFVAVISSSVTPCFSLAHFLRCTLLFVTECPLCEVVLTPLFQNPVGYHKSVTRLSTKKDVMEEVHQECRLRPEAVRRTLATMLNMSLLRSPTFQPLALSGFITMMGFYVPLMYVTGEWRVHGSNRTAAGPPKLCTYQQIYFISFGYLAM